MKKLIKSILPDSLLLTFLKIFYFGFSRKCVVCGSSVRTFLDQGHKFPVLGQLQVVGGLYRRQDECPVCRSNSRTRLQYLYLREEFDVSTGNPDVFHSAPERGLLLFFRKRTNVNYKCGDITPSQYVSFGDILKTDITKLDFPDESFDLVICNHVLEHVEEDLVAMREIHRVLKKGGIALLQTPLSLKLETTRENLEVRTEQDRIDLYGQRDHVRIYSKEEYRERLCTAGFSVELFNPFDEENLVTIATDWELDPFEDLFVCNKT